MKKYRSILSLFIALSFIAFSVNAQQAQLTAQQNRLKQHYRNELKRLDSVSSAKYTEIGKQLEKLREESKNKHSHESYARYNAQLEPLGEAFNKQYDICEELVDHYSGSLSHTERKPIDDNMALLRRRLYDLEGLGSDVNSELRSVETFNKMANPNQSTTEILIEGSKKLVDQAQKVPRTKNFESYDTNSGVIWLSAGYNRALTSNSALYQNAFQAEVIITSFGIEDVIPITFTGGYMSGLALDKNFYASVFNTKAENITSTGNITSIYGQLSAGAFLFRDDNKFLCLQATGGFAGLSLSDFGYSASNVANGYIYFKEFHDDSPTILNYGGSLKLVLNNWMITMNYLTHSKKTYTPVFEYRANNASNYVKQEYPAQKFDLSSLSLTVAFRLF